MSRKQTRPRQEHTRANLPKYSISTAAELSGVSAQQLRRLEESGLVSPHRTERQTRRYSDDDLTLIAEVADLGAEGVNTAGVRMILELRAEIAILRGQVEQLQHELHAMQGRTDQ
jgi:MerR family transcriptional regulator, heat shock protein HspR